MGGRWVPSDYARAIFEGPQGRSRPAVAAEHLAREVDAVSRYRIFHTEAVGARAVLVAEARRAQAGGPLSSLEADGASPATSGAPIHRRHGERGDEAQEGSADD